MTRVIFWVGNNKQHVPTVETEGLPIDLAPVVMRAPDPIHLAAGEGWVFSAHDTARIVVDKQVPSLFLNGLVRPTALCPDPLSPRGRQYWEGWCEDFAKRVRQFNAGNKTLKNVVIDHARPVVATDRLKDEVKDWLQYTLIASMRKRCPEVTFTMYGTDSGPTYWTPYKSRRDEHDEFEIDQIPWLIAPNQWRQNHGNVTMNEWMFALCDAASKWHTIAVWCEPDKVSDAVWRDMFAAVSLINNRGATATPRTVIEWPSWLPKREEAFEETLKRLAEEGSTDVSS